jgi:hypothetical protein
MLPSVDIIGYQIQHCLILCRVLSLITDQSRFWAKRELLGIRKIIITKMIDISIAIENLNSWQLTRLKIKG